MEKEFELRQLFKNRSNCYADAEDVIQAMDENCFIDTINEWQGKKIYSVEDILDSWELGAIEGAPLTRKRKDRLLSLITRDKVENKQTEHIPDVGKTMSSIDWIAEKMMHPKIFNPYIAEAKEKHKQEIIDAWIATDNVLQREMAEQYYNLTYIQHNE
jgi:hypothetical protein